MRIESVFHLAVARTSELMFADGVDRGDRNAAAGAIA